jgi:hypothetical protein
MMRLAGLLLAIGAAAAGCRYSNPYDTSGDVEDLREKTEEDWDLELRWSGEDPQAERRAFTDADLEAWRDTVLATADPETLRLLHAFCSRKIGQIEGRVGDLAKVDPYNREPHLTGALDQLRVEKVRLHLLEDRIKSGGPRRSE